MLYFLRRVAIGLHSRSMPDLRPVLFILGLLIAGLGLAMFIPMVVDILYHGTSWRGFAMSGFISTLIGAMLALSSYTPNIGLRTRSAFLLTASSWLIIGYFGGLPFMLQEHAMSLADAYFETMSGLTTTGSTVMTGLDDASKGILLWRAMLQWYGGIGIIITAMAILPLLKIGGMQLFSVEWADPMGKILPRARQIAAYLLLAYTGLTIACAFSYYLLGVGPFDAICLAMTTLSTGGYANSDASFAAYADGGADIAACVFMAFAAFPFGAFVLAMRGQLSAVYKNPQVQAMVLILVSITILMIGYLHLNPPTGPEPLIRSAAFNVVSVITGTGFSYGDYQTWGIFPVCLLFVAMFIGGCAGSTAGAIKVFRFQVAFEALRAFILKLPHRHAVSPMKYGGQPLSPAVVYSVMGFIFIYMLCYALITMALSLIGLDDVTAVSGAATAINNVGPGFGKIIGPAGTFQSLPDSAKWVLSLAMLLGRLEILPILVVLNPSFWRA